MTDKPGAMCAMSESSVRSAAKAAGSRFYQGSLCTAHPAALRYVASKACVECAKAARKRNADTERDKLRKRAARARAAERALDSDMARDHASHSSIICELVGL